MPTFIYKAIQTNGAIAEGEIEAGGRQDAFRLMEERGLRPIKVAEGRNGKAIPKPAPRPAAKAPEKAAEKTA